MNNRNSTIILQVPLEEKYMASLSSKDHNGLLQNTNTYTVQDNITTLEK